MVSDNRIWHIASHFSLRRGKDPESGMLLGCRWLPKRADSWRSLLAGTPQLDLWHLDLVALFADETPIGGRGRRPRHGSRRHGQVPTVVW